MDNLKPNVSRFNPLALFVTSIAIMFSSAALSQSSQSVLLPTEPDSNGNRLYVVNLRADIVDAVDASSEPPARSGKGAWSPCEPPWDFCERLRVQHGGGGGRAEGGRR